MDNPVNKTKSDALLKGGADSILDRVSDHLHSASKVDPIVVPRRLEREEI